LRSLITPLCHQVCAWISSPAFSRAFRRGEAGFRRSTVARPLCILRPLPLLRQFTTYFDRFPRNFPRNSTIRESFGKIRRFSTSDSAIWDQFLDQSTVVEHKLGMRRWVFGVFSCCSSCSACGMHFDHFVSHLGCTVDFTIISVPIAFAVSLISESRFHTARRAI
jgi:hypothetical protein